MWYSEIEYIGAGLGASNPIRDMITEAHSLFDGKSVVSSLISLGPGHPGVISASPNGNVDRDGLVREILSDCERTAQEMERRIGRVGVYFRFSVKQGMEDGRAEDLSWISAQTKGYLKYPRTSEDIDAVVRAFESETGKVTLNQLGMPLPSSPVSFLPCNRICRRNNSTCSVNCLSGDSRGDWYAPMLICEALCE